MLHRECENKGVTCNKLATATSQSSEKKNSKVMIKSIKKLWKVYACPVLEKKKATTHKKHHWIKSGFTGNTDTTSRRIFENIVHSLISNYNYGLKAASVTVVFTACLGFHSNYKGNFTSAVGSPCYLGSVEILGWSMLLSACNILNQNK